MTERFELSRSFRFEAAHSLPHAPHGHPCQRVHGHSYEVELHISGEMNETLGWVIDFADIDRAFGPLRDELDHRLLNDVDGLENPTSEVLGRWLWRRLAESLPGLAAVIVRETTRSACVYRGPRSGHTGPGH